MIEEEVVDSFLEHHGVKGMHWGVRKDRRSGSTSSNSKRKRNLAIGIGLGAAGLALGVGVTAAILKHKGGVPVSSISSVSSGNAYDAAVELVNNRVNRHYSDILSLKQAGKITPLQSHRLQTLKTRQWRKELATVQKQFGKEAISPLSKEELHRSLREMRKVL